MGREASGPAGAALGGSVPRVLAGDAGPEDGARAKVWANVAGGADGARALDAVWVVLARATVGTSNGPFYRKCPLQAAEGARHERQLGPESRHRDLEKGKVTGPQLSTPVNPSNGT